MPRSFLFVSHYVGMGGGESVQLGLMAELIARGHRLHVLTPRPGPFVTASATLGVQTHIVPFRGVSTYFVPAIYTRWPLVSRMAALLRQLKPDVIHSDYHTLPFIVGAGEQAGIPVLWNAMGGWFAIKRWQRSFFSQRVWRCIAITASVRRDLLGAHPFMSPDQMPVLIPGVDPVRFAPGVVSGDPVRTRVGIDKGVPLVSLIGRFQHVKGQDVFLEMARRVAAELPAAHFALAGDNVFGVAADERFKHRIANMVDSDPLLRERVTFLGFWPDSREVMAASDVIVCSSRFESLGMAVIEAMAMGRPVVSTRVGGPSETVMDGETGFLVDSGDADGFARCVIRLLVGSNLCARIGAAARQHVESALTVHRYADQFLALIESSLT
jgi:glycosyltransferase involved in cell wall biosynthesis